MLFRSIEAQLQESKDTLAETEYDRLISDQKDMLDNLSSEYAQMMESYMKNDDALFREGLEVIKQNASLISDVTTSVADKWGMELSGEMESVVGNINTVDSTLNGIRSDLQDYFASTQEDKNKEDTPVHSNGSRLPLDTQAFQDVLKDRDNIESRHDNDTVEGNKLNIIKNENDIKGTKTVNESTGKIGNKGTNEKQMALDTTSKSSSLGQNDEVIRVDLGDGKIRNLVKVEPPEEIIKLRESLIESPINFPTPNLDNLAKQLAESAPTRVENNNSTHIENVTFSLPNVQNYRDLVKEAQKDKKFETMINHMVRTQLTGGNRLEKFKVMF